VLPHKYSNRFFPKILKTDQGAPYKYAPPILEPLNYPQNRKGETPQKEKTPLKGPLIKTPSGFPPLMRPTLGGQTRGNLKPNPKRIPNSKILGGSSAGNLSQRRIWS